METAGGRQGADDPAVVISNGKGEPIWMSV